MLPQFELHRPATLLEASTLLALPPKESECAGQARLLAGGQSLIAAMKLGLAEPSALIDLQAIAELKRLEAVDGDLMIGSMCTHAQIAASSIVRDFCPMLAELAAGIADQQIRNRGTIGGSLANNDPAADWPCGLLAVAAAVHTNQRQIFIDDFLQGIYATALKQDEIITHIVVPASSKTRNAKYIKFEQKASRFALVAVAVAVLPTGTRITVTGLGLGACLWAPKSIYEQYPEHLATSDLHASAKYRAHLVGVLAGRALLQAGGQTHMPLRAIRSTLKRGTQRAAQAMQPRELVQAAMHAAAKGSDHDWLAGTSTLVMTVAKSWDALLDPTVLKQCIPGCESFDETSPNHFTATIKLGIGMIAVRFKTQMELTHLFAPSHAQFASCTLRFTGDAGALGFAKGEAHIELRALESEPQKTVLQWRARPVLGGKIATLAGRMLQGLAQQLSGQFFHRFEQIVTNPGQIAVPQTLFTTIKLWFKRRRTVQPIQGDIT